MVHEEVQDILLEERPVERDVLEEEAGGNRKDPDGCRDTITDAQQTASGNLRIRGYSKVQRLLVTGACYPAVDSCDIIPFCL